jgi:uncharacterized protein (DUF486 family)
MSPTFLRTAGLLIISNTFMTFAWYAHLRFFRFCSHGVS